MDRRRKSILTSTLFLFILSLLIYSGEASAATLEWVGPNGTASPWETASNWENLANGANQVPTNVDTARLYNALTGHNFTDSNVTVSTTTAIAQRVQMRYLTTKLTILTGAKLTTTGSVEMYQGTSAQIDIQAGATFDACTKANTTVATFKIAHDDTTTAPATVNVWGTLNVISQNPANGTSELQICNMAGGSGTGTLNIYSTGRVNVDAYGIGSYGTGRIYITEGGIMTVAGDVTSQANADIAAGKILGTGGASVVATYNTGENKTYIAVGSAPPPGPPPAPASITYPSGSNTGKYTVSWTASSGASSYQLERSNDSGGSWILVYSGAATSYAEEVGDGSYRYRVKATNSEGSSNWTTGSIDCFVSIPPPASYEFQADTPQGWDFYELDSDIIINNTIDWDDLNVIAAHWLSSSCGDLDQWCGGADIDSSTGVDFTDYALLANDWGKQGAKDVLLQTIYGTEQDADGVITANTLRAMSKDKGCAMAFAVPQNTALYKGIFKCAYGSTGWRSGEQLRVRLYDVTGKGYLTFGHSVSRADPGSGGTLLMDLMTTTPSPVPYHSELDDGRQYSDLVINFGPLEVAAGEYFITFDPCGPSNTWGNMVRGSTAAIADAMGKYPDGTPLPKRATVTTTSAMGNTYHYEVGSTSDTSYTPRSYLLACQILTTIVNHRPVVNAGPDQLIAYPLNTVSLAGIASDDGYPNPPGVLTTTWSKVSGPGTVTFGDIHALNTTATFSDLGVYTLKLDANDGELSASDTITITYAENQPPTVDAGYDQTVGIADITNLHGTVTDDGLPNPPGAVTTLWTQQSGPGTVTFGNANAVDTTVTFSEIGTYVLRLTANDGEFEEYDEVTIEVLEGSLNDAPIVDAGPDKTITIDKSVILNGSVVDDGKPNPPGVVTILWTVVDGPGTVTFANANVAATTATFSATGVYILRLTAYDGLATSYDDVTITVNPFGNYEGYAPLTKGGEGGTVIYVTNLADSGAGSLRAALSAASAGPTIIKFNVSGTICPTTSLWVVANYTTIAGETAPGPGITIDGTSCSGATFGVSGHDLIMRHLRIRNNGSGREIIQINSDHNLIFDHLSVSGGGDGLMDINNGVHHITVSNCIFANGTEAHRSYGKYASLHHNFYYGNNRRQPKIVNVEGPYDWRNNVVENWTGTGTNVEAGHQVNIINNYYGPNTANKAPGAEFNLSDISVDVYIAGNRVPAGHPDINLLSQRETPNEEPPVTTYPADENLPAIVKCEAGAKPRDSYDAAIAGACQANQAPTVNAGPDKVIISPQNSTTLAGTVTDDGLPNPPGAVTIIWTKVSGPGTVTFGTPSAATTTATFSALGTYVLRLTANDGELSAYDDVTVTYQEASTNNPPVVNAGPDQTITLPANATLNGSVTDDGLPNPPGTVTISWTKTSGPGTVTFGNASAAVTTASFSTSGTYVLRLTANDSQLSSFDEVTITVNPAAQNQAPTVNAGPDQTITLPSSANLDGTVTDDGLPNPPGAVTTTWTKQSGPGTVTFGNASAVDTTATFSVAGTYVLRLTANDSALSAYDEVTITVNPKPGPAWSESANYYVDGISGSDTNTGTSSAPFKTISKALTVAKTAGNKVLVWGGQTYSGALTLGANGTSANPITIKRDPASGAAIIDGGGTINGTIYATTTSYNTIDGFTITNGRYGVYNNGAALGWIIKNCRITGNSYHGVYFRTGDNHTLTNNVIYGNGSGYDGVYAYSDSTGHTITQCSIYKQSNGIRTSNSSTITTVRDCIVANCTTSGIYNGGTSIGPITYCDVWNNGTNYYNCSAGTGCISADPKWVNPASGDFHLQAGSPCDNTASDGGDMGYRYSSSAL